MIPIRVCSSNKLGELCDISLHVPVMSMQATEDMRMIFDHWMMNVFYKYLRGREHLRVQNI